MYLLTIITTALLNSNIHFELIKGNLATLNCVIKTQGVPPIIHTHKIIVAVQTQIVLVMVELGQLVSLMKPQANEETNH